MDPKNDSLQRGFSLQVSFAFSDGWKKKTHANTNLDPRWPHCWGQSSTKWSDWWPANNFPSLPQHWDFYGWLLSRCNGAIKNGFVAFLWKPMCLKKWGNLEKDPDKNLMGIGICLQQNKNAGKTHTFIFVSIFQVPDSNLSADILIYLLLYIVLWLIALFQCYE